MIVYEQLYSTVYCDMLKRYGTVCAFRFESRMIEALIDAINSSDVGSDSHKELTDSFNKLINN